MSWTEKDIAKLREYCKQDLSAGDIAEKIGRERNAVIGKVHRLGLKLYRAKNTVAGFNDSPLPAPRIPKAPKAAKPPRRGAPVYFVKQHMPVGEPEQQHGPLSVNFNQGGSVPGKIPEETVVVKDPIRFDTRPHGACGWIIGEPRNLMCCGAPSDSGRYYCASHILAAMPRTKHAA